MHLYRLRAYACLYVRIAVRCGRPRRRSAAGCPGHVRRSRLLASNAVLSDPRRLHASSDAIHASRSLHGDSLHDRQLYDRHPLHDRLYASAAVFHSEYCRDTLCNLLSRLHGRHQLHDRLHASAAVFYSEYCRDSLCHLRAPLHPSPAVRTKIRSSNTVRWLRPGTGAARDASRAAASVFASELFYGASAHRCRSSANTRRLPPARCRRHQSIPRAPALLFRQGGTI